MFIILLVGVADILVVLFVRRPFPWVVLIPALVPLLVSVLIIFPMTKAQKPSPTRGESDQRV